MNRAGNVRRLAVYYALPSITGQNVNVIRLLRGNRVSLFSTLVAGLPRRA